MPLFLVCAMWVPEAFYRLADRVDYCDILHIPAYRFDLVWGIYLWLCIHRHDYWEMAMATETLRDISSNRSCLQECDLCKTTEGACCECSDPTCPSAFHVPCALNAGIQFQYKVCSLMLWFMSGHSMHRVYEVLYHAAASFRKQCRPCLFVLLKASHFWQKPLEIS